MDVIVFFPDGHDPDSETLVLPGVPRAGEALLYLGRTWVVRSVQWDAEDEISEVAVFVEKD